jgi:hypothetical protein
MVEEGSRRQGSGSGEMARGGVEVGGSSSTAITHKGIRHTRWRMWLMTVAALRPPMRGRAAVARVRPATGRRLSGARD